MKIAVNTRFLIQDRLEGFGHYTHEIMSRIVKAHPADDFHFYFDRPFAKEFLYTSNVRGHMLGPHARHPLLFYIWYQHRLRRALQQLSPAVFFSPDSFMPLRLKCPAVITVHDVAHRAYPEAISFAQRKYYDFFMPKFIGEASSIITVSHFSKQEILNHYPIGENKVHVIYNGIGSEYKPLNAEAQQETRKQISHGAPYFLFVGAIHPRKNVARLVEAYTMFRTQHAEQIKLVIAGRKSWDYGDVEMAIEKSSFRSDIIITGYVSSSVLARITASAHALCYFSLYEGFGLPVVEAMACGIPVLVTKDSAQEEVAGTAGLSADARSLESMADAMNHITYDTALRTRLTDEGKTRSTIFSWDQAAKETFEVMEQASLDKKR